MKPEQLQKERLQKVIAESGLGSRRKAEEWIRAGQVNVNGKVVSELGVKVTSQDIIEVDGVRIKRTQSLVYVLLYKPIGVMTTTNDPQGRRTVVDCLTGITQRVFPVGRLDYDTSGLLLLTNDGDLAHRLMHPRFGIEKRYEALVEGRVSEQTLRDLHHGIMLDGKKTAPAITRLLGTDGHSSRVMLILHEGRNRQVRRMFEAVGHPCLRLVRVQYGSLTLRGLRPGEWRFLRSEEVAALKSRK